PRHARHPRPPPTPDPIARVRFVSKDRKGSWAFLPTRATSPADTRRRQRQLHPSFSLPLYLSHSPPRRRSAGKREKEERRKRNEKDDFGQPRREKPIRRKTVGNRPRPSATCPLPPWFASSPD